MVIDDCSNMGTAKDTFLKLKLPKQKLILDGAIEEFATWGFHRASINRLVQTLGIAKGSIFQYFGNKEGLFAYVFDYAVDTVRQTLRKVKRETADADFFSRLRESLLAGIFFIRKHPKIYRIYLKMVFQEEFPLRERYLKKIRLFSVDYLQPLLEAGIEKGEIRSNLDPTISAFVLDAVLDRFMQAYAVQFFDSGAGIYDAGDSAIREKLDKVIDILRLGLANSGLEKTL